MPRYATRAATPRAYWLDEGTAMAVVDHLSVPEHGPVDTGLVDARGDAIMRLPNPVGFGRDGEWS